MASPWVHCADKIAGFVPPKDRLDSIEKSGLEMATAATLYQQGGSLDARWLLLSAIAGICVPRILKYIDESDARKLAQSEAPKPSALSDAQREMKKLHDELETLREQKRNLERVPVHTFPKAES